MKSKPQSRKSILEKLEERVLFDASPDGNLLPTSTVFDVSSAVPLAMDAGPQSTGITTQQQGVNLVFIASNADNVHARLNEFLSSRPDKSFQVHWLGADSDSVSEVGGILESMPRDSVESVWFLLNDQDGLSAESGSVGDQWWAQQPGAIAAWSAFINADTELVLPGMENADLVENLQRLTGATVLTNSLGENSPSQFAFTQNSNRHSTTSHEIIFVDTSVENYESLLAELLAQRKAEVILLDGTSDGILQMAAALAGRSGIDAIHLISHGSEGILHAGTATLDAASMQSQYLTALTQIGAALDAEGDFLIYGCNFTSGDQGLKAAMILGGITEADIAASSDLTGHQGLNADWELESHVGVIQTSALIAHRWQGSLAPIAFDPLNGSTVTAQTLAEAIAGTGVNVISATFTGDNSQAGLFNNAQGYTPNWLTYDSGVLLSTGSLNQVLGPNTNGGSTVNAPGTGSNPDLAAIGGNTAFDAAVLEFSFIPTSNRITLQFTFGSEEYNEYVYSNFNDAMAVWVNGINAATTPGNHTISINSINQAASFNPANGNQTNDPNPSNGVFDSSSPSLYRNNAPNSGAFNTGMDGFTVTLTVVVDVNIGVSNTIRIGIADIGDASLDSFLFVRAESLQGLTIAETDSVATGVNLPVTIDVLENDFDSQGFPLTITHVTDQPITAGGPAITLGSGATVSLGMDGQLTYTPPVGYLGKDLLTYTISNGNGNVALGYIDISIVPKSRPIVDLNGNDFSPSTTIADSFVLGNYNNNSGATNWSAGWIEGNDDGNSGSGSIQIVNDGTPALRIGNAARTIARAANLSAYSHATLSFDFRRVGFDNINDFVAIEVSADGTNFTEIGRFYGPSNDATYSSFSAEISSFISANTTIRFRTSALLANNEFLFVDNVNITAIAPQTSFSNSYTENGPGVAISATTGAGVNIIDNDSANLSRAIISITNAVAGDQLSIAGTLPAGITAVFSGGGTTITLQGAATRALYETAIEQVRFSSTSNNPTALTRQISVVVYDESNLASNPAIASITVTPVNDDATAVNDTNSTNQNSQATGNVLSNDIDPENDPLTVTQVNGVAGNLGQTIAGSNGGTFVVNGNGSYTFDPGSSFAYLAAGESATTTVNYSMTDGQGGLSTATVTITVNGLNDAPVSAPIGNQSNNDSQAINLNIFGFFSDPDTNDSLTFSVGGLPPGLSLNPSTGLISGTINSNASTGGPYSITIIATDSLGASTSQSFIWIVANPIPVSQNDEFAVDENGTISGNVFANNGNGVDSDPDGDSFSVTAVAGGAGNVSNATTGSNGGLFTINSDGTLAFDPNGQFDYLALGESATTTITYTITDADGATSTATVSVLVSGSNDDPVTVGVISNQSGNDSSSVNLDVSSFFADPDTSDTLTFSAGTTLPPGLSINPTTGVISGTLDSSASVGGPYTVVITATDSLGATVTQTFVWTVTNPIPVAQNDNFTVNENGTISGNVLANNGNGVDSDPDGDSFSVTAVAGGAGNVSNATVGSNGGLFTIGSDGTLAFDPNFEFDYLADGESATTTITYTITDADGAISTATVSVLVSGSNDDPVTVGVISNQSGNDSSSVNLDVSSFFADPDTTDPLTFSAGTTLPPGLSINPTTGVISGTLDSSASVGGPYTVVITATDSLGATVTQTFVWTVTNPVPVAQDDNFTVNENGTISGNVFANNGNGVDSDPDGDSFSVTAVAGGAGNVSNATVGSNGGLFTIGSDGTLAFDPNGEFDYLADGESATTTITYTITDADGATSTATVSVLVSGSNDDPVTVGVISNQSGNDSSSVNLDVSSFFADPDTTDPLTFSAGTTLPPGLSINPTTGVISGTLDSSASVGGPYTVVITATDSLGATVTQTFVWTVTNPVPVAQDDNFTVNENGTISGNVFANNGNGVDSDPDGDSFSVTAVAGGSGNVSNATVGSNGGLFTIGSDGTLAFDPNGEFDYLALGESATTTITYTITDADGAISTATVSVLVSGSNDDPVTVGVISNQSGNDSSSVNLDVSSFFADPDTTDPLTFSAGTTLPPGLSINPTTGVISGTLDSSASTSGPYTVTITATDPQGATVTQTFVWTVTNPVPVAQDDNFTVNENGTISGNVFANNGNGVDSDPDGDSFSVTAVAGGAGNVGNATAGSNGGLFTINSDGTLAFDPNGQFDYLALGESATTTITYTITDADGATSTATVSVLVSGSNDDPVTVGVISNQSGNDSSSVNLDVSSFFADPDTTDPLAFSAGTTLPPGLSINPTTGVISGTLDSSASVGGPYTVVITATDPHGVAVTQTFVWTVTNPIPVAQDDNFTVNENGTISGNVFANNGNGIDSDLDGDSFSVTAVAGGAGNVSNATVGSNGGLFTIGSDGTLAFDPNGEFDYLADGESATTTITYPITDADGATSTATVSVLVSGSNDDPVTVGVISNQSGNDSTSVNLDVSSFFADPDTTDTLTFSAGTTLPPGLSINPTTGVISGTLDSSASTSGPYTVTITATDPQGATVTQTFVWAVTNPVPVAQDDNFTVNENGTISGNVFANNGNGIDSDLDGDSFSVTAVAGGAGNVSNATVGSNGGLFTIGSDGTLAFDPNGEFDYLADGESATTTITYTITDADGATSTATVSVLVSGSNDDPVTVGVIANQSGNDSSSVNLDVSSFFADPDSTDPLTFSAGTTLPPGLSINPTTGVISGTLDSSASVGGPYTVVITATDPHGVAVTQTFVWTVTNPDPLAQNDSLTIDKDNSISGNVFADNGNGMDNDPDGDTFLVTSVGGLGSNVGNATTGSNGGSFTINSDGSFSFDPNGDFNYLASSDSASTSITYSITDVDGATSTATATVLVTGTNDAPIAVGTISNQNGLDSSSVNLDVSSFFSDPNAADTLTFSHGGTLPPGLSIHPTTGIVSGILDSSASASGPYSVVITATDPHGASVSQTFVWVVTNPAPVSQDDSFSANEDGSISGNMFANNGNGSDSDPDGDNFSVTAVAGNAGDVGNATAGSNGGLFSINSDGTMVFNTNGDFNYLADGESATTTISYTITDADGATSTATVSVLVNGSNDSPVAVGVIADQNGNDSSSVNLDVSGFFADPDTTDTLTFSAATTLPPGLSINPGTGVISGTLDSSASVGGPYTVVITATDPHGASVTQTFVWVVANPVPVAQNDIFTANEDGSISGNVFANNGNGSDSDPDGDSFSVTAVAGVAGNLGNANAGSNGGQFTINGNGTLAFDPNGEFDYLADGESATTTISYTITDADGATSTATVSVLVNGSNDSPVAVGVIADQNGNDSSSVNLDVSGFFADPDTTDTLTFSAATTLPPGLSINPGTGVISGTLDSSASVGGPYTVVITATDPHGASVTQTFVWVVANPVPVAQNDIFTANEDGSISGNVFANNGNGSDSDPDGDSFSVTAVAGVAGNLGNANAGSNGGQFTINGNGTLAFDPNGEFDYLADGESATTSITYTITDADGATSTATVSVLVSGSNDAPVAVGVIADQNGNDSSSVNLDVSSFFAESDATDTLAFSAGTTLPPGLSINPSTGVISGLLDSSASVGGPYTVVITATDPHGASVTQTFVWVVTNPVPVAQNDIFTANEDGSILGNVFTNNGNGSDSDADGDNFSVTAVAGNAGDVGNATAGSTGGLFTINSDGTLAFDTNGEFNYLADGESATTMITYTITDSDGATSTATVSVLVSGSNDAPVTVGVISNQSGIDSSNVNLDVSGFFDDPDTTNTLTFNHGGTLPPGLSLHPTTGVISGTLNSSASVGGPYTVVIFATDPQGATVSQTFVWVVTNPTPVAQNDNFIVNENGAINGNVFANNGNGVDGDLDGDTFSVTAVAGGAGNVDNATAGTNGGQFTINSDGTLAFNPNGQFDYLALGESATTTISYTITDADGATSTATVSVLVNGSNNAPITVGVITNQSGNDSSSVNLDVSGFFDDPDSTDTLTFSHGGTLPPGLSIHPTTGVISGTLNSSASVGGPYTVVITATDPQGATVTQIFFWTVTNPTPIAQNDNFNVNENGTLSGNVFANNGNGIDSDPDGDSFTVTGVAGVAGNVGSATAGSNGGLFTINSNGTMTFNPNGQFDYLALGQSATTTINYTITDADGASSTATVSVLVTGTNDAPVTVGVIANQNGTDSSGVNFNVSPFFADPDTSNTLAFSAGATLPPGLSINPSTGVISGVLDNSASVGGPYTVVIIATDPQGASVTQTFVWIVNNLTPIAANDNPVTTENTPVGGNVLANDSDPDGDTLTVTQVNLASGNVGATIVGSNGGSFVINSDGTYLFNPGTSFDNLSAGETRATSVTYLISDGEGGTASATVTVTVQGRNDAPGSTPLLDQSSYDSDTVNLDVSGSFTDQDNNDGLTFSDGDTLPPGLSIDPLTGIVSGTIDSSASVGGPYTVTITATDPHGATTSQTFTWNATNRTPVAVNDQFGINGTASATNVGNALGNDSDQDGDSLSVLPQTSVAGSNGGVFSIAADGTITFDPAGNFDHIHVTDSLTTTIQYTLIDADGATSTATISITVIGANQTPIANNDRYTVTGSELTGNAFDNDFDPNGDTLSGSVTIQPQHGSLVWQPDGTFTYTPGPSFLGNDQFTYVVRDIHGATSSAVVHINSPFAWDSFRNESIPSSLGRAGVGIWGIEQLVSYQLESLGSQPILAGYATPGAILKGRVYDLSGAMLAESTTQVNAAGNWVMNFYQTINSRNVIVIIDHVATEEVLLADLHHFRLTDDTYRSLQLRAEHTRIMTPGTILSDRPSLVLEQMHRQNLNPLALL